MGGRGSGQKADEARRAEMARLRDQGLTLTQIGGRLGVSRQCVQELLAKAGHRGIPVRCRACRRVIGPRPGGGRAPRPTLCLGCLDRRPRARFADRLRTLRLTAGLTQGQLASRAGLSTAAVVNYEHALRRAGPLAAAALARVLGSGLVAPQGGAR